MGKLLSKVVTKAVKVAEGQVVEDAQKKADDIIRVNTPGFWIGLTTGIVGTGLLCLIFRKPQVVRTVTEIIVKQV